MRLKRNTAVSGFTVRLATAQDEKFKVLADSMGLKDSEAIRRLIDEAYERHLEGLSESKLDAVFRGVQALLADLTVLRVQGEAMRSVESLLKAETAALRSTMTEGSKDSKVLLAKIYFDLRAIFEKHPKRDELIAERERLMREA